MAESVLNGKRILAVDDEPDVLAVLEEEILGACPSCKFDKASDHETAVSMLKAESYDLVILDIMGVRGFDLLKLAVSLKLKVAMLTAHSLNPEALKRAFDMKARAYLPKEKLGEIVPFLENILKHGHSGGWRQLFAKLEGFFSMKFEGFKDYSGITYWQEIKKKLDDKDWLDG